MAPLNFYVEQWSRLPAVPKGPLLKGKNIIITGANSGLGVEVAKHFATMSPGRLILTARNLKSGQEVVDTLRTSHPDLNVELRELDLSKYSSIIAFADKIIKEVGTIDLLMNNAGVNLGPVPKSPDMTEDHHELSFQTNAIAPVLILLCLLPALQKSSKPKVIFTTSEVHSWAPTQPLTEASKEGKNLINFMDGQDPVVGFPRYMQSKLFLQMSIRQLIQALPDMTIMAVNPGLCLTNFGRHFTFTWNWAVIYNTAWVLSVSRKPEVGARNLTHAAVGDYDSCEYFTSCQPFVSESTFLASGPGLVATRRYWKELLEEMENAKPGCTQSLKDLSS